MQAIRTIIWVFAAVLLTVFALSNYTPVRVNIFPGAIADTYLTVVIVASFLIGFLPPFIVHLGNGWRMRRQISKQEQTIAQLRAVPAMPTVAAASASAFAPADPPA